MKKVIFQMSVSLDGYIEGPNREIDWHLVDDGKGRISKGAKRLAPRAPFSGAWAR